MTRLAAIIGASSFAGIVWVLWSCRGGRAATPQRWSHYHREPLVKARAEYIKSQIRRQQRGYE